MKKIFIGCFIMVLLSAAGAFAADKSWNGEGDGTDWFDSANWLPKGKPDATDDAKVDKKDAAVDIGQPFETKSLVIGGKKNSAVSVDNFVTGSVTPSDETNNAVTVRRDGKLVLKGSTGKLKLKGSYKDSEEVIPDEPSFMLYVK